MASVKLYKNVKTAYMLRPRELICHSNVFWMYVLLPRLVMYRVVVFFFFRFSAKTCKSNSKLTNVRPKMISLDQQQMKII